MNHLCYSDHTCIPLCVTCSLSPTPSTSSVPLHLLPAADGSSTYRSRFCSRFLPVKGCWTVCLSLTCVHHSSYQAGVLFDVDGVLLRGRSVLPGARQAIRKLLDQNNNFLFPVVFVTNAGSCQRRDKAEQLSNLLDVQITPEQVVLSHSPLQMMKSFHDRCVLVCGQGSTTNIANTLGFQKVLSIEQLAQQHPLLDMVDHQRKPTSPSSPAQSLPQIQAIILFGEPIKWETNLQLLIDVLLTNGRPGNVHNTQLLNQLPILACNMDLLWMAEAPSPR
uniref:Haloacid dehalogenase like hydrolase domain containing 5 n=1 Tax=Acanthochromis polyacanthus TaxID=80966 RepID=A0A3Q1GFC8_9TELE